MRKNNNLIIAKRQLHPGRVNRKKIKTLVFQLVPRCCRRLSYNSFIFLFLWNCQVCSMCWATCIQWLLAQLLSTQCKLGGFCVFNPGDYASTTVIMMFTLKWLSSGFLAVIWLNCLCRSCQVASSEVKLDWRLLMYLGRYEWTIGDGRIISGSQCWHVIFVYDSLWR